MDFYFSPHTCIRCKYTFLHINDIDTFIRKFVSIFIHSHREQFLQTSGLWVTPPVTGGFRFIDKSIFTVTFSRLHRASDKSYFCLMIAGRSINVGVSGRYSFIPPIGLSVLPNLVFFFFGFLSVFLYLFNHFLDFAVDFQQVPILPRLQYLVQKQ